MVLHTRHSQLMEIQTENAYSIVDKLKQYGTVLLNALKEIFSLYVADNIDRNEETFTGIYPKFSLKAKFKTFILNLESNLNFITCKILNNRYLPFYVRHRNYTQS